MLLKSKPSVEGKGAKSETTLRIVGMSVSGIMRTTARAFASAGRSRVTFRTQVASSMTAILPLIASGSTSVVQLRLGRATAI